MSIVPFRHCSQNWFVVSRILRKFHFHDFVVTKDFCLGFLLFSLGCWRFLSSQTRKSRYKIRLWNIRCFSDQKHRLYFAICRSFNESFLMPIVSFSSCYRKFLPSQTRNSWYKIRLWIIRSFTDQKHRLYFTICRSFSEGTFASVVSLWHLFQIGPSFFEFFANSICTTLLLPRTSVWVLFPSRYVTEDFSQVKPKTRDIRFVYEIYALS